MSHGPRNQRFFASTRGKIISLLRRASRTVEELADRRLAAMWSVPPGEVRTRLERAVEVLNELGGLAELERRDGTYVIQGYSCPLAAVVPGHPEVCQLAASLLTELVGMPVQEQCDRGEKVGCRFVVPTILQAPFVVGANAPDDPYRPEN
jgi:predicted ArsR family transcriptional regulator